MPAKIHRELDQRATSLGLKGKRHDAYVYSTLAKIENSSKRKKRKGRGVTDRETKYG